MLFWTVFFRFYDEQRTPEIQDVFDIMISGFAPYVEVTLTEVFQAEIFRKVQRRDTILTRPVPILDRPVQAAFRQ